MTSFIYKIQKSTLILPNPSNLGKISLLLLGFILSLFAASAKAEGSRELVANGGYRPYLEHRNGLTAGISRQATIKVFVNAGEQINLGSSVHNSYNTLSPEQDIVYKNPSGMLGSCDVLSTGFGFIDTTTKENLGPIAGGYTPCVFTALETGIYEITFRGPITPSSAVTCSGIASTSPPKILGTDPFPTDNTQCRTVAAWDVTVFKSGVEQKGRVYANYLPLDLGEDDSTTPPTYGTMNSQVYFLTNQGYLYRVNLNGIEPQGFIFFANNKGFKDSSTGNPLYKSIQLGAGLTLPAGVNLHNPGSADTGTDITHKMFFNLPDDDDLPDINVALPGGTTWLRVPEGGTTGTLTFKGVEGTANQAGTAGIIAAGNPVGNFNFDTVVAGSNYTLTIDTDGDNDYDSDDRVLTGTTVSGTNIIPWDGKDKNGTALPPGTPAFGAEIKVAGYVHFPFLDVENNASGFILERLDRTTFTNQDNTVYYDNGDLGGTSATGGVSSASGAQIFSGNFGNNKGIDTWTFAVKTLTIGNLINLKKADLSVTKTHSPTSLATGSPITYTITVTNGGPSDVTGVGVQDTDLSATASWTCTPSGNCASANGTGSINTSVNLPSGAIATFTVNDTVTAAAGTTVNNTVTITRPNDVTNPQGATADVKTEIATDSYTVLAVPPANQPPVVGNDSSTTTANTPVAINVLANDSDPDGLNTANLTPSPTSVNGGTITRNVDGTLTYTPPTGFTGTDTFTYQVCDNGTPSACSTATVAVTVTVVTPPPPPPPPVEPTNAQPELQNDTATTDPNTPVTVAVLTNDRDPDGGLDRGSVSISVEPKKGTVTVNSNGTITYTPNPDFTGGKDTLIYQVCDMTSPPACNTAVVTITIPATANQPPVTTDQTIPPISGNDPAQLPALSATDDGTVTSYTITTLPAPSSGILYLGDPANGGVPVTVGQVLTPEQAANLFFQPQPGFIGTAEFTFTAKDNTGAVSEPTIVSIPVATTDNPSVPQPPVTLTVIVEGNGEVFGNPNALYCNEKTDSCKQVYDVDSNVILTPVSAAAWRFEGWVGDCDQNGRVVMATDKQCKAVFVPITLPAFDLTVSLTGGGGSVVGTVLSQPTGIDCGSDCKEHFADGMSIALTATAKPGFIFRGWSGDCSGTGLTVSVTMNAAKNCIAQFAVSEDDDGVPTDVENAAPNGGDGNNDGIPDSQQSDVASLVTPDGQYITLITPGQPISEIQWKGEESLLEFVLASPEANVTVYYYGTTDLCGKPYRQWLPSTATWQDLEITCVSTTLGRRPVTEVHFKLKDGGNGDNTPVDGVIQHISGWVLPSAQVRFATDVYMIDELGNASTITVQRLNSCIGKVSVDYASQDGTATQNADYVPVTGTITWADGDCGDKYFTVPIKDDTLIETAETVDLSLANVEGNAAVVAPDKAVLTITDNDSVQTSCYATPTSQVCCAACQASDEDRGVNLQNVLLTIKVGQSAQILLANNVGILALQEIPDSQIAELNTWKSIGEGAGEIGVTGIAVGKTRVVITNNSVPAQTTTIRIEVIPNENLWVGDFSIHAVEMTLIVGETRTLTIAGGQGDLSIKEIPAMSTALLEDWIPLGDTGAAKFTLKGQQAGTTQMVIGDLLGQEVTVTIQVLKGDDENTSESTSGDGSTVSTGDGTTGDKPTCTVKNALAIDTAGAPLETPACFINTIQIASDPPVAYPNHTEFTAAQGHSLELSATILVDTDDVGQAAEVLLVGVRTTLTDERRYTRDDQTWIEWDDRISSLPTAQRIDKLPAVLTVPIYTGDLSFAPGEFTVFVGYRLASGKIVFNGKEPLHFHVGNASSFDLQRQDPKTLSSNDVEATTFFESLVYNTERKIGNHQMFAETDIILVSAFVHVDTRHVGKTADILVVAVHRDNLGQIEYTHTLQGWQVWDDRLASLSPIQRYAELPSTLEIPLAITELPVKVGEFVIYVGYRLSDNVIIFNGLDPLHLTIN